MVTPFYQDEWLTIHGGDCRAVLRTLEPESVHCVVTSPPYWGLRDYGTATWEGGDCTCDHAGRDHSRNDTTNAHNGKFSLETRGTQPAKAQVIPWRGVCGDCGARRVDSQLGLETTPDAYVSALVETFREVRRVLRADGTVWLNLGDSYQNAKGQAGGVDPKQPARRHGLRPMDVSIVGLKPKDLVGIPWMVAFALRADGWWLRKDIIWAKPNPMPESVADRPVSSHEYVFLLSKSKRYYYDAAAVAEPATYAGPNGAQHSPYGQGFTRRSDKQAEMAASAGGATARRMGGFNDRWDAAEDAGAAPLTRNLRSVWTIATAPYPGAHFATFPPKLVEPCIKAGTSARGVCPECGAPWERVVERGETTGRRDPGGVVGMADAGMYRGRAGETQFTTTGWRPTCAHTAEPVPATCLDLFAGTGTVGMVAQQLSRRAVLIDLNPDYLRQCLARNAQSPLGLPA